MKIISPSAPLPSEPKRGKGVFAHPSPLIRGGGANEGRRRGAPWSQMANLNPWALSIARHSSLYGFCEWASASLANRHLLCLEIRSILERFVVSSRGRDMAFKQVVSSRSTAIFRPWAKKDNSVVDTATSSPSPSVPCDVPSAFRTTFSNVPLVPLHHPLPVPDLLMHQEPKLFELPEVPYHPPVVPIPRDIFGEKEGKWKVKKQRPKKFQCETCRVSFSNNGQLIAHRRIHSGW